MTGQKEEGKKLNFEQAKAFFAEQWQGMFVISATPISVQLKIKERLYCQF